MTRRRTHRIPGPRAAAAALLAAATLVAVEPSATATAAAEPPARIALTGARIIPVVGEEIASGTVLIEFGRITAVGADVEIPYDATEYDLTGKVVFPGMIDPHSSAGLDVPNETLPVAPFLDVYDAIDPSRSFFENALRDGLTSVHVMQADNTVIGGVSRVVRPIGLSVDEMTVATDVGLKMSTTPRSGYGRMRQMAELREAFLGLADERERLPERVYEAYLQEKGERLTVGPEEARRRGEALVRDEDWGDQFRNLMRLTRGDLAGWVYTGEAMDVAPAIELAREHGFLDRAVLVVGPTAYKAARTIRLSGRPVVLPGDLFHRERDPMTGELESVFLPLEMHRAGIEFSLVPGGGSMAERYLNYLAAVCVREGVPRQAALEAITINPARALGLEESLGSLEPGKIGNVVVFSGDPLAFDTWVEHVFIDGVHAYNRATDPRLAELMKLESTSTPAPMPEAAPAAEESGEAGGDAPAGADAEGDAGDATGNDGADG